MGTWRQTKSLLPASTALSFQYRPPPRRQHTPLGQARQRRGWLGNWHPAPLTTGKEENKIYRDMSRHILSDSKKEGRHA